MPTVAETFTLRLWRSLFAGLCGLVLAAPMACSKPAPPTPETNPSSQPALQKIGKATAMTIPVRVVASHQLPKDASEHVYSVEASGVTPPGALELGFIERQGEEAAQGPNAFDVSSNGTIVVTDPVNHRIAAFAALDGAPRGTPPVRIAARPLAIGFAADFVGLSPSTGSIQVREASTGSLRAVPSEPLVKLGDQPPPPAASQKLTARLLDDHRGVVTIEVDPGRRQNQRDVTVAYTGTDGDRLVSVTPLGVQSNGRLVVVLEIGRPSVNEVSVRRVIQAYDASATLVAEATDVPPQADIAPSTEFKDVNGVVYQLVSGSAGAIINAWDMRR